MSAPWTTVRSTYVRPVALVAILTLTTVALAAEPRAVVDDDLTAVLSRFDGVQSSIRTMTADFTWTTTSPLLSEPIVADGRLYLTKPDAIRWEFVAPEEMSFVIAHDEYIGYFPARKKAERSGFGRWSEKMFRYLGVGQGSEELSKVYDIRLGDSDLAGADLLVLEPRKRRARKRIEQVNLYVDRSSGLPTRVVTFGSDGGTRELKLRRVVVNPELEAAVYQVSLPPDVTVTSGTTGLGGALRLAPGPSR